MLFYYKNRTLGRVWFMALVLKTSTPSKSRRFKSDSARNKKNKIKTKYILSYLILYYIKKNNYKFNLQNIQNYIYIFILYLCN